MSGPPEPPSRIGRLAKPVAALLLMGVVAYLLLPLALGPDVAVERVQRAEYVQTVVASGNVAAPNRINIGSQLTGIVVAVPVAEGQAVRRGDVLVRLDDREARAAVVQAEGAVAQAAARLRQVRELNLPTAQQALRQAEATLADAQKSYDRAVSLARDAYGTRAALDDATRDLGIAQAQLGNARFQVFTNSPGGPDETMANTQLDQSRANLEAARARLGYTVVTAPADGTLISRNVEVGYVVQPSGVLMKLSPAGKTQLVVDVDEKNIGRIHLGEAALAEADAYPGRAFAASVAYINPGVDIDRATVQVKLDVADPPAFLMQDMTVSVDIETARRPGALVLSAASVHDLRGRSPWVMVADAGRARRQAVKLGLTDIASVEVLEGVREGDLVLPASATLEEGARVRAHAPR